MKKGVLALLLAAVLLLSSGCGYLLLEQNDTVTVYQEE